MEAKEKQTKGSIKKGVYPNVDVQLQFKNEILNVRLTTIYRFKREGIWYINSHSESSALADPGQVTYFTNHFHKVLYFLIHRYEPSKKDFKKGLVWEDSNQIEEKDRIVSDETY